MDTQVSEAVVGMESDLKYIYTVFTKYCPLLSSDLIVGAFGVNKAVLYRYVWSDQTISSAQQLSIKARNS